MEKTDTARLATLMTEAISSCTDEILSPSEAGALFGISGWAMYKRVKNGTVQAHHCGRKLYFLRSELIDAVKRL